jgi:hypothetical protein
MKEINPSTFLTINKTESIELEFQRIANKLINEIDIVMNETFFSLYDCEFYYYSPSHKDGFTLPHSKPIGDLRMHDYGIDISLGFEGKDTYGGILIRGVWMTKHENSKVPQTKSQFEISLFNSLKLGQNTLIYTERNIVGTYKLFKTIRKNLGKIDLLKDRTLEMLQAKYRFISHDISAFTNIKGKEKILRNSTLPSEDWQGLLTYNIHNL